MRRTAEAREIAERMGFHPIEWLLRVAVDGVMLNPDGTETVCDTDQRLDAAKTATKYLTPVPLASKEPEEDKTVEISSIDINRMMEDPALVEAAQTLALAASSAPSVPDPVQEAPLATDETDDGSDQD
jgi:hypothetical protein